MSGLGGLAPQERDLSRRRDRQAAVVLAITGEIDIATAPRLRERLNTVIDRGMNRVVIDLAPCRAAWPR